jgi:hypothetical protein
MKCDSCGEDGFTALQIVQKTSGGTEHLCGRCSALFGTKGRECIGCLKEIRGNEEFISVELEAFNIWDPDPCGHPTKVRNFVHNNRECIRQMAGTLYIEK